jgi:hypothetical protein
MRRYSYDVESVFLSEAAPRDLGTAWYGDLVGNSNVGLNVFSSCSQV